MQKNPPRTKMESKAPKVLSRYLSAPSASCHDHCKGGTKEPTEKKPITSIPRRIPKTPTDRTKLEASNSINRIKKTPSVVPKITTRNVKNSTVVKDPIIKKGVGIEPKSRDLKPKSENSQAKKNNPPSSRTSTRRHSDMFLPDNQIMPLPSTRVPNRRLSEIGIRPKKDVVSASNTSLIRSSSRINKNEPKKDSKLPSVNKKPNSIKPTVSSPQRGAKVPPLRSYKSLPQSDLKTPRKSKPMKPIKELVPEKTLQVVEPSNNAVETTKTESQTTPDSSPGSLENVLTDGQNGLQEYSPPMDDDTTATSSQNNDIVADLKVIDTNEETLDGNLVVETTDSSTNNESHITPDSSASSEETITTDDHIELQEGSPSIEDDTTAPDGQDNENVEDSEVVDTKEAIQVGKLAVDISDFSFDDLEFRRGKFLCPRSEGSSPRKVQFKEGKEFEENESEKAEKIILRRMSFDGVIIHPPESQSVSVDLKHQEMAEKEAPELSNKVIEETTNKLIQTRKSKVKALVGAFENIVSSTTQMS